MPFPWHKVDPDSSVGITTELPAGRSRDRIPVGPVRSYAPVQTRSGARPAFRTMGIGGPFSGLKWSGRGV